MVQNNTRVGRFLALETVADFLEVPCDSVVAYVAEQLPARLLGLVTVNELGRLSSVHSSLLPEFEIGFNLAGGKYA